MNSYRYPLHLLLVSLVLVTSELNMDPIQNASYPIMEEEGYDGIIRHDVHISNYERIGKKKAFNCVGRYSISKNSREYATGVLVSPTWVLTASHFVRQESVWKFGSKFYKTKKVIRHPNLSTLDQERKVQWDGWDLALVELESSVAGIKPAILNNKKSELNELIYKIGYGIIGDGISGQHQPSLQKRLGGNNVVDAIGGTFKGIELSNDVMICDFDNPDNGTSNICGSPEPVQFEIGGSKGDSGGGIFAEIDGELKLIGIVSGALGRNVKYGSAMLLCRISSSYDWIDSVIHD